MTHGIEDVKHIFLASTQALEGLCLSLDEAVLFTDVEALFVEVTGRFIVILLLEVEGNLLVAFEAFFGLTVAVVFFSVHKIFT